MSSAYGRQYQGSHDGRWPPQPHGFDNGYAWRQPSAPPPPYTSSTGYHPHGQSLNPRYAPPHQNGCPSRFPPHSRPLSTTNGSYQQQSVLPPHYSQYNYQPQSFATPTAGCRKHSVPSPAGPPSGGIVTVDLTSEEDLPSTDGDSLSTTDSNGRTPLTYDESPKHPSMKRSSSQIISSSSNDDSDSNSGVWMSKPKCKTEQKPPPAQKRRAVIEDESDDSASGSSPPSVKPQAPIIRDVRPKAKKQVSGTVGDQLLKMRNRRDEGEDRGDRKNWHKVERMSRKGHIESTSPSSSAAGSTAALSDVDDSSPPPPRTPPSAPTSRETTPILKITPKIRKQTKAELKDKALEMFNTGSEEELSKLPRCSAKMAATIVTLRPFTDYMHLLTVMRETKGVNVSVADQYLEQLVDRSRLDQILSGCEQRGNRLTYAAEMLQADKLRFKRKPRLIPDDYDLKSYQLVGLNWLVLMHTEGFNAILADEMGLGKTIQIIAFLAYLKQTGETGPNLIVVPSSTLDNWMLELKKWCPSLEVQAYYGSPEDRKYIRDELSDRERRSELDVLLTTYSMITTQADDRVFFKSFKIHYVIYDEAHYLKNCTTSRYQQLMKIRAKRKILLTGTPLQNNLIELISLMYFVMSEMFNSYLEDLSQVMAQFKNSVGGMAAQYESQKIAKAQQIMMPFVLRRLKADVLKDLPGKTEQVRRCEMADDQSAIYTQMVATFRAEAQRAAAAADDKQAAEFRRQRSHQLMQLRKAANHPLLHRRRYTPDKIDEIVSILTKANPDLSAMVVREQLLASSDFEISDSMEKYPEVVSYALPDEVVVNSGKFKELDLLLPSYKEQGLKVLIFSQLVMVLDIMERYMSSRQYSYLRLDGATPVIDRQDLIQEFNTDQSIFCFLLSTRAGGLGINLTSANVIILHDIDFNPYNDRQAEDRCHRMGQTKEVTVIKLISKDTVEEKMLACAMNKLKLERDVTGKDRDGGNALKPDDENEDVFTIEHLLNEAIETGVESPLPTS